MKKGFTLVELAIVLVVIGILLGMAIKGRALMEVAQIKADVNKLQKISAGYAIYFSKFNKKPGDNGTWDMMDNLTKEGTIGDADFVTKMGDGYWGLTPCSGTDTNWGVVAAGTTASSVCLAVVKDKPTKANNKVLGSGDIKALSPQFICYIETNLDNKDVATGDGRMFTGATKPADINDEWDCAKLTDDTTKGGQYMYRIF